MDVQGKVVIVTGASSGIGLAAAELLARHGAKLALVARSRDALEALASRLPDAMAIVADLADEEQARAMVGQAEGHFGRVDVLINNAGRGAHGPLERFSTRDFRDLFALDLLGPLVAMQAVIPGMRQRGGGMIVNISSGTSLRALPNLGAYSSLKRALNGLSLTARAELAPEGIVVSVVYPYVTATNFFRNALGGPAAAPVGNSPSDRRPPPDTAEHVAEKILEALTTEAAEVFAHEWMQGVPGRV